MTGAELFAQGLIGLGYRPMSLPGKPDHVVIDYEVESGRLKGTKLRQGFVVPSDFPLTPPSGPHISTIVYPNKSGGEHPTGGVHDSQAFQQTLGGAWQYWSRPFQEWASTKKSVAAYMGHIWRLWDSQ